jgi:hypothetical protein
MELFEFPDLTPLDFCLWGWMKSEIHKRKLDTPDELHAQILVAVACVKERKYQPGRTTRVLRTRVANCLEVGDEIFEYLL